MKPPPRKRGKPNRPTPTEGPRKPPRRWNKTEEKTLLNALQKLGRTALADGDTDNIDYSFLGKRLPKRSVAEIRSVVDALKDKAISSAALKLRRRKRDEKVARKPIEEWANLASTLAGSLEGTVDAAFSQVLIVSSTEPCTLRNCDPPRDNKSSTSFGPPVRIVPLKPASRPPTPVFSKSPAPSTGPSRTLPAPSPTPRVPQNVVRPPQEKPGTPSPTTPDPPASPSSEIQTGPPPSPDIPSASTSALAQPSSSDAGSEQKAPNPQRVMEVKQIVDFERIYKFLSVVHKPEEESRLTSMESAIVLDLLMSLPDELPLLDCNGLHNHMMKMYSCLTASADSVAATQLLSELKDGGGGQTGEQRDEASSGTAAEEVQPPAGSSSSQSQDSNQCKTVPPLNPFMVPLSLLVRKAENTDGERF
ncbi:snRNA-activating protein complex subunit 2 [Oryzias latipes]|nr:snRNA-activating protein complex subunit 2 [Oryzias latipes]